MIPLFKQDDLSVERRKTQRVRVALLGRFMREDKLEYACRTIDMSPGSAAFFTPVRLALGEKVIAYLDQVGRIEGIVARVFDNGFAIQMALPAIKREKLADQLTWLANRHELGMKEDRRHERIVPQQSRVVLKLDDGRECTAKLIDISVSGAAVTVDLRVPLGTPLEVGTTRAKVVRVFEAGLAVEFVRLFNDDEFGPATRL